MKTADVKTLYVKTSTAMRLICIAVATGKTTDEVIPILLDFHDSDTDIAESIGMVED